MIRGLSHSSQQALGGRKPPRRPPPVISSGVNGISPTLYRGAGSGSIDVAVLRNLICDKEAFAIVNLRKNVKTFAVKAAALGTISQRQDSTACG